MAAIAFSATRFSCLLFLFLSGFLYVLRDRWAFKSETEISGNFRYRFISMVCLRDKYIINTAYHEDYATEEDHSNDVLP